MSTAIKRAAALEGWARTTDPAARTRPARDRFLARFVEEARERFGLTDPTELERSARFLMRAHMARLGKKAAESRKQKATASRTPKGQR